MAKRHVKREASSPLRDQPKSKKPFLMGHPVLTELSDLTQCFRERPSGGRRTKIASDSPVRRGDTRMKDCLNASNSETTLAGYLLFPEIKWLRRFMISWPILKSWTFYSKCLPFTTKPGAFNLLNIEDQRYAICQVENPLTEWPLLSELNSKNASQLLKMNDAMERDHRNKRVAWCLIFLVNQIGIHCQQTPELNHQMDIEYRKSFTEKTGLQLPMSEFEISMPHLGAFVDRGENDLERYHRAWQILQHFSSLIPKDYKKANTRWIRHLATEEAMNYRRVVGQSNLPTWMRPEVTSTSGPSIKVPPSEAFSSEIPSDTGSSRSLSVVQETTLDQTPNAARHDQPEVASDEKSMASEDADQADQVVAQPRHWLQYLPLRRPQTSADSDDTSSISAGASKSPDRACSYLERCIDLLACKKAEAQPGYHSMLFGGKTECLLLESQIVGAVTSVTDLNGKINGEQLLAAADIEETSNTGQRVLSAAPCFDAIQYHGHVLEGCTGIDKIRQCLATAVLQAMNNKDPLHKPIVLLAPSLSLPQWLNEIQCNWPCFRPVMCYDGSRSLIARVGLDHLTSTHMREKVFPSYLQDVLDQSDHEARYVIIISTYDTHKARTSKNVPAGEQTITSFSTENFYRFTSEDPKQSTGNQLWDVELHTDIFGLLIADEAHALKASGPAIWSIIGRQNFDRWLLVWEKMEIS